MAGIRILAIDGFYVPFVKFINFFAGALVATTAANVLLASDAYASINHQLTPPNGWTQQGKSCQYYAEVFYKLRKDSNHSMYGVYRKNTTAPYPENWVEKDITLAEANAEMNSRGSKDCSGY